MAIDTPAKRLSVMNLMSPWRPSLPIPDGEIDQYDRLHLLYLYSGYDLSVVVETPDLIAVIRGLDTPYIYARGRDQERETVKGLDTQYIHLRGRD